MNHLIEQRFFESERSDFYLRFKWSSYLRYPSMFLAQLNYLKHALVSDKFNNAAKLCDLISEQIEVLYLDSDELVVPDHYAEVLLDLCHYRSSSRYDLTTQQLKSQQTKLKYLAINTMNSPQLRDHAVAELSTILKKCAKEVDVKSEVEGLAFVLDKLTTTDVTAPDVTRDVIEAITFIAGNIRWAIPIDRVVKIINIQYSDCAKISHDTYLYRTLK